MSDVPELFKSRYFKRKSVNVFKFVDEICEKSAANFSNSVLNITYSIPKESMYCSIDTELLERAIYNMIANSVKAQSKNIHIDLKQQRDILQLSVSDDGYGMINEQKSKILTKFKEKPALNFSDRGLGLGMLIIHAAAFSHNGTVLITDVEPRGCKVTLTIQITGKGQMQLSQNPVFLNFDPLGGVDPIVIELAEFLPPENF